MQTNSPVIKVAETGSSRIQKQMTDHTNWVLTKELRTDSTTIIRWNTGNFIAKIGSI